MSRPLKKGKRAEPGWGLICDWETTFARMVGGQKQGRHRFSPAQPALSWGWGLVPLRYGIYNDFKPPFLSLADPEHAIVWLMGLLPPLMSSLALCKMKTKPPLEVFSSNMTVAFPDR